VRVLSHPDDSAGEPSTSQADFMLHVCLDGHGYVVDKHQVPNPKQPSTLRRRATVIAVCKPPC
jgi:hypothetical protein